MSSLLSAEDLNDFIRPSVACIKPVEEEGNGVNDRVEHVELEIEVDNNGDIYEKSIDVDGDSNETGNRGTTMKTNTNTKKKKLEKASISLTDCLACSGCITSSEEILVSQHSYKEFIKIFNNLENNNKKYVLHLTQQVRSSLSNYFKIEIFKIDLVLIKIFCEILNFKYILSVNNSRRIIYKEIIKEVDNREGKLPILSSICPGFVLYIEKTQKEINNLLSNIKSPQFINNYKIKELMIKEGSYVKDDIFNLNLMPCFDKKLEGSIDKEYVDFVITPKELINMIQGSNEEDDEGLNIDIFEILEQVETDLSLCENVEAYYKDKIEQFTPKGWDKENLYGWGNDLGSSSGGYAMMYLEIRKYQLEKERKYGNGNGNGNENENERYEIRQVFGRNKDIYELHLIDKFDNDKIINKSGVINGFKNIQNLVRKLKEQQSSGNQGSAIKKDKVKHRLLSSRRKMRESSENVPSIDLTKCEYVEVMACPSGCINGGGQLVINAKDKDRLQEVETVYQSVETYDGFDYHNDSYTGHVPAEVLYTPVRAPAVVSAAPAKQEATLFLDSW